MATFTDFGHDLDFLFTAFYTDSASIQPVSVTSTRAELLNPETGGRTILTGTGLAQIVVNGQPSLAGTVTGVTLLTPSGLTTFTIAGIVWNATSLLAATNALVVDGDNTQINALLNLQPITYDGTGAVQGLEIGFDILSVNQTLLGSRFGDYIVGGSGNDTIRPGAAEDFDFLVDLLFGSGGNDTYDLRGRGAGNFTEIDYSELAGPITATINGVTNTGTVTKTGVGTDTILGVKEATEADGVAIIGTTGNDVFNLATAPRGYVFAAGGRGNDTFSITPNGDIGIGFHYDGIGSPTGGININLTTGVVSSDGYGGRDQINFLGGAGRLQIEATDFADTITGSARNELFILRGGNDTVNGGGGNDALRYDRNGSSAGINGNLETGVVTGVWNGAAFRHTVSNIFELRGTNLSDTLVAKSTGSKISGNDGNDTITGGTGIDDLRGGDGNDVIRPGTNDDYDEIETGAGIDEVIFDAPPDPAAFFNIFHWSLDSQAEIDVEIDTRVSTTGRIDKGAFGETTLTNVQSAVAGNGLRITGSAAASRFDIALQDGEEMQVLGGRGVDSYVIGGTGLVVVNFQRDENNDAEAEQGVVVNLATGAIANDGFGYAETITFEAADTRVGIRGTRNADSLTGSATHAAEFTPGGGSDTIRGGAAFETVNYWLNLTTSGVRVDLGQGSARGTYDGVDFVHQLSGIEGATGTDDHADRLIGSRGANTIEGLGGDDTIMGDGFRAGYAVDAALQVYRLYQATLDRAPDTAGQIDWTLKLAEGTSGLRDVAAAFVGSREFTNVYGSLNNTAFVTLLYNNVLDRAPDAAGLQGWLAQMSGGASRAQVVLGFSESREFVNATRSAAQSFTNARVEAGWTDDVYRLYQATLDRAPDAAGFSDWIGRLGSGTSFLSAVQGFVGSREFQRSYGALDDTAFVTLLYSNVLNRAPDAGGLANWLGQLSGGKTRAEVVEGFAQAREFVNATAPALTDFVRGLGQHDTIRGGAGTNDLWGGILSDQFEFNATDDGQNRVLDFEVWDTLAFRDFGYDAAADVRAHLSQAGANVVFVDQGVAVTLLNVQLAALADSAFVF